MKLFLTFAFALVAFNSNAQTETFDITTYTVLKGWKKSLKEKTVSFSKENSQTGGFCTITIYKAIDAGEDAKKNFDASWKMLLQPIVPVGAPVMQPATTDKGWQTHLGSAAFEKNGIKGVALLVASTNKQKQVNFIIVTNSNAYEKELHDFLESVSMKGPVKPTASRKKILSPTTSSKNNGLKPANQH